MSLRESRIPTILSRTAVFFLLAAARTAGSPPMAAQPRLLDDFETLAGWEVVTTHGDAAHLTLAADTGKTGRAMVMDFKFIGFRGNVMAEKEYPLVLPEDFEFTFDIRGHAAPNNFEFRLLDSAGNVWRLFRPEFEFPRTWKTMRVKKALLPYAGGPAGTGAIHRLAKIQFVVSAIEGGTGRVWVDNLRFESAIHGATGIAPPDVRVSSSAPGAQPRVSDDGMVIRDWRSAWASDLEWLTVDFRRPVDVGGLVIDWDGDDYATAFDVLLSMDGATWKTAYSVTAGSGGRNYVPIPDGEGSLLKLSLKKSSLGRGYWIRALQVRGAEFSYTPNHLFREIAREMPAGFFPRYFQDTLSSWTVVGVVGDRKEGLFNEEGMLETDRKGFSLEPFLYANGRLISWNDVRTTQSLEQDYLPIPSVTWTLKDTLTLTITTFAYGTAGNSVLMARYTVRNTTASPLRGKLFVAVRPFQVNPPWQDFTIAGGVSRIDSIRYDGTLKVNTREVVPVTAPSAVGAAGFDQGDITRYLRTGTLPLGTTVHDRSGFGSAVLAFDLALPAGGARDVVVAVPFHRTPFELAGGLDDAGALDVYEAAHHATATFWRGRLEAFDVRLPGDAQTMIHTVKSNLAYISINGDSVGTQPGSRSYERSSIRDGALASTAMLYAGITEPVREFIDWYTQYQYPDGKIPRIVDTRGPDPVPEHDSPGQFIHVIMQYFHFTKDTSWLRGKWENVDRAVRYIQALRARRKTDEYLNGTPEQRACYGLVPESISHEGYSAHPRHSYWDQFFVIRGLKDATTIASILGETKQEREFAGERDDFRKDLYASLRLVMKTRGLDYIPGCVELGDWDPTSTTIGISPCGELGLIPEPELTNTFERFYAHFKDRKEGRMDGQAYLPYEMRIADSYLSLGRRDRALELLDHFIRGRRPTGWNQWAEVALHDRDAPRFIGEMPHSWAGSDYIRAVRSLFVYERESDGALIVGAGIDSAWVVHPGGVEVRNLPTYFGALSYRLNGEGSRIEVEISGEHLHDQIILTSPLRRPIREVVGSGFIGFTGREVRVSSLPARMVLSY